MIIDSLKKLTNFMLVSGVVALGACSSVDDLAPDDLSSNGTMAENEAMGDISDEMINNPPNFKVGDSFSFNNPDMTWSVMGVDSNKISWKNDSGDLQTTDYNPLLPALEWASESRGKGRRLISNMSGSFFPLKVGQQVLFKTTVNTDKPPYAWEFEWTCDFVSRQNTTVPAGSFDTFRVDCYRQKPELWSFYYAPKIGYYVKMESNTVSDPQDKKIRELVSFSHNGHSMEMMASDSTNSDMSQAVGVETQPIQMAETAPVLQTVITTVPLSQVVANPEPQAPVVPKNTASEQMTFTGYGMHVESYKNLENIDAAWDALIKKYPNQLAGFQKIVKRVDLGSKGIFDRLIIGPLDSKKNAENFCAELIAKGQKYCQAVKL